MSKDVEVKGKFKSIGSRKQSLRVMQSTYSSNRFYLTFPRDDSWNFGKVLSVIKKLTFTLLLRL